MEIKSEKFREVPVTYIDISYLGSIRSLSLKTDEGDSYYELSDCIVVSLKSDGQNESIVLYKSQMQWRSIRTAVLKYPLQGSPVAALLSRSQKLPATFPAEPDVLAGPTNQPSFGS